MEGNQTGEEKTNERSQKKVIVNKLVLLGDCYVGKTSIAYRFTKGEFSDFQESTVGAVFMTHGIDLPHATVKFDMWDTAGQERYRSLAPMYYKGAKAAVVVYDITSYETFRRAKEWIEELNQNASPNIIIALVGNKLDLEEKRAVQTSEAREYAEKLGLFHFETSAKRGTNLNEVFLTLAKKIPEKTPQPTSEKIDPNKQQAQGGRCC
mmetsp:Transcript_65733/g.76439  ORF Transcript_65733/g.76439 Transcript_65733/m.76439 type:complete len:208 (+) Transcript_65733:33-656(+)